MAAVPPECSFEDLIQSDLFTFYIGEEKKPFIVHSKAVAATSEYFRALVTGDMAESRARSAELQDVRPEDFARYLEYAYRHDYTVPPCAKDCKLPEIPALTQPPDQGVLFDLLNHVEAEAEIQPVFLPLPYRKIKKVSKKSQSSSEAPSVFQSKFKSRNYLPNGEPKTAMLKKFVPESNSGPKQDFSPVFLAHARLYTFASTRLIDPLKALALHKLHRTLVEFQLYHERVGDVVELARHAYNNGGDREEDGSIEELRSLVVEYIASNMSVIRKHKDFMCLLEEGGEFVSDLWRVAV